MGREAARALVTDMCDEREGGDPDAILTRPFATFGPPGPFALARLNISGQRGSCPIEHTNFGHLTVQANAGKLGCGGGLS